MASYYYYYSRVQITHASSVPAVCTLLAGLLPLHRCKKGQMVQDINIVHQSRAEKVKAPGMAGMIYSSLHQYKSWMPRLTSILEHALL